MIAYIKSCFPVRFLLCNLFANLSKTKYTDVFAKVVTRTCALCGVFLSKLPGEFYWKFIYLSQCLSSTLVHVYVLSPITELNILRGRTCSLNLILECKHLLHFSISYYLHSPKP